MRPRLVAPGGGSDGLNQEQHPNPREEIRERRHRSENRSVSARDHDYSVDASCRGRFHAAWVSATLMGYSIT